jgi:8-oxo-dGTP pyrophosphatase MutT (NUDIX family)
MTPGLPAASGMAGADGPAIPPWLAGLAGALASVPVPPLLRPPGTGGRRSAILILFGPGAPGGAGEPSGGDHDDPDLLLIQRMPGLRRHGGQPAFPGGAIDPDDAGPVQAALREAAEEVGLDPAGVDVAGTGPELYIAHSGFRVIPVLGWWRRPVATRPADPAEVALTVRVPISALTDPANRLMIRHPSGHAGPAFRVGGLLVWGFTAGVIDMLLTIGGWQRPWDSGHLEDLPAEAVEAAIPDGGRAGPPSRG